MMSPLSPARKAHQRTPLPPARQRMRRARIAAPTPALSAPLRTGAKQPKRAEPQRTPPVAQATVIGDAGAATAAKKSSRASGAVQLVAGSAIALVGVPMLILPGPGLLAIGGGVALAASGLKKLAGK